MARAPQNVTLPAARHMPAPPAPAPSAPSAARNSNELAETAIANPCGGQAKAMHSGKAAPAAKVAAEVSAA